MGAAQAAHTAGMSAKQRKLLSLALQYIGDTHTGRLGTYAYKVRQQMALMDSLTIADWVQMAQILTEQAIAERIRPGKIADAIYPSLAGLGHNARLLALLPPEQATSQLLHFTGIAADPRVKTLLADVITELQRKVLDPNYP